MSENSYKNYVGIDVSKKHLDVCIKSTGEYFRTENNAGGFKEIKKRLSLYRPCLLIAEATGGYESDMVRALQKEHFSCAVVNPRQVRDFAKALGKLAKTDKIDSSVLAHFGEAIQPPVSKIVSEEAQELGDTQQRRRQLVDMLTMEKNRYGKANGNVRKQIKKTIEFLEKQLKELDKCLTEQVNENEAWRTKMELLKSIKGIGQVIALTLVSDLPELGQVSRKEIAALVGVAPLNRDSGLYQGQRGTWGGRASVRSALYMGTLVAVRHNSTLKAFYDKLCQAGKKKKVALIACLRKLLVIMNTMIKNNTPWQPKLIENQVDYA